MNTAAIRAAALADIAIERERQITHEGYSTGHDDGHDQAELARAAASYALYGAAKLWERPPHETWRAAGEAWPFAEEARHKHPPRRLFVIAAAFLLAEIERLDRAEAGR